MNNDVVNIVFRTILLIFLQVVLFDYIELFGYIAVFPYLMCILLYPIQSNRYLLLLYAFFLGLCIDIFNNSGGVHAASCVTLAYFRKPMIKFAYGFSYEYHLLRLTDKIGKELITYTAIGVLIHHSVLYVLEIFNFRFMPEMLLRISGTSLFTIVTILIMIALVKPVKR